MKLFPFDNLTFWQKSRQISIVIYKTTNSFPDDKRFGLISQMRRYAISISSNIAEGTGRHYRKDKARFTEITAMLNGLYKSQLNQYILNS